MAALPYLNLVFAACGGAALATAARLWWAPTEYAAQFPTEYCVLAAALAGCGAALLLLTPMASGPARRALLVVYASGTALLAAAEVALAVFLVVRLNKHIFHTRDATSVVQMPSGALQVYFYVLSGVLCALVLLQACAVAAAAALALRLRRRAPRRAAPPASSATGWKPMPR